MNVGDDANDVVDSFVNIAFVLFVEFCLFLQELACPGWIRCQCVEFFCQGSLHGFVPRCQLLTEPGKVFNRQTGQCLVLEISWVQVVHGVFVGADSQLTRVSRVLLPITTLRLTTGVCNNLKVAVVLPTNEIPVKSSKPTKCTPKRFPWCVRQHNNPRGIGTPCM